ncbi:MAG: hypothetical protein ACPG4U_12565 [Pseudomonadales bacterium]
MSEESSGRNQQVVQEYLESLLEDLAFAEGLEADLSVDDDAVPTADESIAVDPLDIELVEDEAPVEVSEEALAAIAVESDEVELDQIELVEDPDPVSQASEDVEVALESMPEEIAEPDAVTVQDEDEIQREDVAETAPTELEASADLEFSEDEDRVQPLEMEEGAAAFADMNQPEPAEIATTNAAEAIEADEVDVAEEVQESVDEDSINCVIVLMYGLKLAIPFEDIEGMIKLGNVTLELNNNKNWILGDFTSATMRTHVVDTAQTLFGDNYDPIKSNYHEMLVLNGKHWSIVFDKIIKAKSIPLSGVTENPSPQFRPWLTGTYMEEKCALINVPAMIRMFEDEFNSSMQD